MKPQVRWTTREWELLAKYFVDNSFDPDKYGFSAAFDEAQKSVLPSERWRSTAGGATTAIKKMLKEHMQGLEYAAAFDKPWPPEPVAPPPGPEALSTEELLVELARRLAKLLETSTSQTDVLEKVDFLERKFEEARIIDHGFHKCATEKAPEKVHKPCILVCGPNGYRARSLTAEFPGLDLRFIEYDTNPAHVKDRAKYVDSILCITKFVKHSTVEAAHATKKPCKLVTSVADAREFLSTL